MCRIAGIINPAVSSEEALVMIKGMCRSLEHGGPDDEGIYENADCNLVLGHRRLSLIDISACGHQPMFYGDGRYVISYNGELYNYQELKQELVEAGACFTTNSDTEVLVSAYANWGINCFNRLSGMFAFSIWDNVSKELVMARDPGGIKPVYYAFTKEGFSFASEVQAFSNIPWLQESNQHWPVYFMAYGHLPEPITLLKNVQPLEKGSYLIYHALSHTLKTNSFGRYKYLEKIGDRAEAIQVVKAGLEQSVKKHLISDAPIGVFLSGGVDSSVVAALADKFQANLRAISIYFDNKQYSEKKYQDALQAQLSCRQQQFLVKEEDFHSFLPTIIRSMDLPSCDGINTWFISKYAKESGLKAVLSGIGGDELFGGYPSFKRMNMVFALEKLPKNILRAGRVARSKKIKRLPYLGMGGPLGRYLFLRGQHTPIDIARFLNTNETEVWQLLQEVPRLPNIDYLSLPNQASWMETNLYMQNQLLRDADVMSMAHGLEIRVPFLDGKLVETVFKIKSGIKYSGSPGKKLLIDSFKDIIPEMIWNRPKMGFSFPFKEWLKEDRYAASSNGIKLGDYHKKLQADELHWSQFFTLMVINNYYNA